MDNISDLTPTVYLTKSTSKNSAELEPIVLEQTGTTRKILKAKIVNKDDKPTDCIEIQLIHERRPTEGFYDLIAPKLNSLNAGEWINCTLNSATTRKLYEELTQLYTVADQEGVPYGQKKFLVFEMSKGTTLSSVEEDNMLELMRQCQRSPGLAKKLAISQPDLIDNAHKFRMFQKKQEGVARFKVMLGEECSEQEWHNFFDEHDWIFGGVLEVQILSKIISQPIVQGASVLNRGEKRADFLLGTRGDTRFSALAEIKKPTTELIKQKAYRLGAYPIGDEVNGGLAQLRNYLYKWQIDGSRSEQNKSSLENQGIYTVQPKGILIIGHLDQLKDSQDLKNAFELFRQNQKDIHIVTFDEVYQRALYLLGDENFSVS